MKIYIAGPITGLDYEEAVPAFIAAAAMLETLGHEPLDPMTLVDQNEMRAWEDYILDGIEIILNDAEALYMLDGWRESKGARLEHAVAESLGRPIYYQASELPKGE